MYTFLIKICEIFNFCSIILHSSKDRYKTAVNEEMKKYYNGLDVSTKRQLLDVYREDFESFGYEIPSYYLNEANIQPVVRTTTSTTTKTPKKTTKTTKKTTKTTKKTTKTTKKTTETPKMTTKTPKKTPETPKNKVV